MFKTVTLLGLISQIPNGDSVFRTCIPYTQFQMNGHICYCDGLGRWSETDCEIFRRQNCQPGQIIWDNCKQCICQENGHLQCITSACEDKTHAPNAVTKDERKDVSSVWCLPFVSYYTNCSLCVCPASGKMSEARCAKDASCPFVGTTDVTEAVKKSVCIPKITYLFPCLQCDCSHEGFFDVDKCVETCRKPQGNPGSKCNPNTFYRKECNICRCPENSVVNEEMCTKNNCNSRFKLHSFDSLKNRSRRCVRNKFTSPQCFFCECRHDGTVDKSSCLESECMNIEDQKYPFVKDKCSPGEMVPICIECLCLRNGLTDPRYYTQHCSLQQKLFVLESGLKDSSTNHMIIDSGSIKKVSNDACEPNTIYLDDKYCLCPDNGNAKFKHCTNVTEQTVADSEVVNVLREKSATDIDYTAPCEPSTFVEFNCNTCYCLKTGQLDPNWCTFDDCEAKMTIQNRHKSTADVKSNAVCVPGSITKDECNFCICPENGQLKDRACTKNSCVGVRFSSKKEKFSCEPLAYYNVDCNTCYCPENGLKNVAKCTKNVCEKSFLRSDVCVPGTLFSDICNVCVCPPNGDKADRVCTNNTCTDVDTPWKKIFKLSQSMTSHLAEDTTRSLELCFPGEEFEVGCKVCVCPDMGLRIYATCTHMLCGDDIQDTEIQSDNENVAHNRMKRDAEKCMSYKIIDSSEQKECTPGSMYIVKCRQCICPYMGNINYFCRPLPRGTYCEQPYPGYNYLPMGRRNKENDTGTETVSRTITVRHNHTTHVCSSPGNITDECFVCECEPSGLRNVIIEEHCFKSDAASCVDTPLVKPCEVGQKIENKCNRCICTENEMFQCSVKYPNCKDTGESSKPSCLRDVMYLLDDTICICNSNGYWPHKACNKTFQSLRETKKECEPNAYVVKDCNICRCGTDGYIDVNHCTKNICNLNMHNNLISRRFAKQSNVYGNCDVNNWYSLAPCQFCFCVNENKLVCNTGNAYSTKLELGAYNLSACGKDLIREAIELIPDKQNFLRYNVDNKPHENKYIPLGAKNVDVQQHHAAVSVNRENEERLNTSNKQNDNEYYSDSEEKTETSVQSVKLGREVASTHMPYDDNKNDIGDTRNDSESEQETDDEMSVEFEARPQTTPPVKQMELITPFPTSSSNNIQQMNLGDALKLNLPMVLGKMFQMALRKSMVSVDLNTKCTPGAASVVKCNTCFCMNDNKLLCTNNVCTNK